jgi:hypothetical protein
VRPASRLSHLREAHRLQSVPRFAFEPGFGSAIGPRTKEPHPIRGPHGILTISRDPRRTPHRILENHSSSWARPSSGSSTKSAKGLSSKIRENWLLSLAQFVTVGVTFRKILKPT